MEDEKEIKEVKETIKHYEPKENKYSHFCGVKFLHSSRSYYFSTNYADLQLNDRVVVETVRGKEVGWITTCSTDMKEYTSPLPLAPVLRKATDKDIQYFEQNIKDAEAAFDIFNVESKKLGLDMRLIYAEYTLDKTKITFTYSSDDRVDFRELLKVLAARLRTRIDLRQIGSRDKAKMIGGIGLCGLPLCCSTFLNEFDGISISRARNQMLAINIPKLSGHCGKLICCLKFEDDTYTDLKKQYPPIGDKVLIAGKEFSVSSYNVISTMIKIDSEDETNYISLEEYKRLKNPPKKPFDKNRQGKPRHDKKR